VLAGKGVIAWRRIVAGLAPAEPFARPAGPPLPAPPAALASDLVSALASLAMPSP
jgi:hypothetical protein